MATRFPTRTAGAQGIASEWAALGAYFREFVRNPKAVGSPIPSFRHTADRLLAPVDWRQVRLLVEYGPGTGRFTAEALKRMRPHATLLAIDSSPGFTDHLREAIPDSRLRAVTGSAQDVEALVAGQGLGPADCILSGLPFSTLPDGVGEAIVRASHRLLRPGGLFVAYQVRDHIRSLLERDFTKVGEAYEWRNLPPYHLYWFRKQER
jgi:phospholipid N-methyltransferase